MLQKVTLLKQSRSFRFLFMYLGEQLQYYQSSNNLPTCCWLASVSLFVALVCLGPWVALLVVDLSPSQSLLLWFGLLGTSSHSTRCRLVSVSLLVALVCFGPRVVLLVVVLSPSQSFMLCVAQHLELLCSFLTCLRFNLSSSVLLNTTPRVALLIVDLSPSQSLSLWFAQHIELICSLLTCLDCFNLSCFVLKPRLALVAVQSSLVAI